MQNFDSDIAPRVQRDAKGLFLKGMTLNPGGRPTIPPDVKAALKAATPQAVQVLVDGLSDEDPRIRLVCANAILDRSLGKPKQETSLEISQDGPSSHIAALVAMAQATEERINVAKLSPLQSCDSSCPVGE